MEMKQRLESLRKQIPENVTLVAVSKTHPPERIMQAYQLGQRVFGENKAQELSRKYEELPKDIEWHMIGHLQRNKVKYIASFVDLIHSVDSERLLVEINKQAGRFDRTIDCLFQVHIAEEETKFGLDATELSGILESYRMGKYPSVRIRGLMGMATLTEDTSKVTGEFAGLHERFDSIRATIPGFDILSMGMSGDYMLAIQQGSTMVRVGSAVFGPRSYSTNQEE